MKLTQHASRGGKTDEVVREYQRRLIDSVLSGVDRAELVVEPFTMQKLDEVQQIVSGRTFKSTLYPMEMAHTITEEARKRVAEQVSDLWSLRLQCVNRQDSQVVRSTDSILYNINRMYGKQAPALRLPPGEYKARYTPAKRPYYASNPLRSAKLWKMHKKAGAYRRRNGKPLTLDFEVYPYESELLRCNRRPPA